MFYEISYNRNHLEKQDEHTSLGKSENRNNQEELK